MPAVPSIETEEKSFKTMIDCALSLNPVPDQIIVSTFNEFHENTHIEPSVAHGSRYLDMTPRPRERGREKMGTPEGIVKSPLSVVPYVVTDCSRVDLRHGRALIAMSPSQGAVDLECRLLLELRSRADRPADGQLLLRVERQIHGIQPIGVGIETCNGEITLSLHDNNDGGEQVVSESKSIPREDGLLFLRVVLKSLAYREVVFERNIGVFTSDEAWLRSEEAQQTLVHNAEIWLDRLSVPWYAWPQGSRVHVVTVSFRENDAVGAFTLGVYRLLSSNGIACSLYADACDLRLRGLINPTETLLASARDSDVVFFNFSIFDAFLYRLLPHCLTGKSFIIMA